jgi:hypothetical protein
VFDVLESIDNTHGFNIKLDNGEIIEIDFLEIRKVIINV